MSIVRKKLIFLSLVALSISCSFGFDHARAGNREEKLTTQWTALNSAIRSLETESCFSNQRNLFYASAFPVTREWATILDAVAALKKIQIPEDRAKDSTFLIERKSKAKSDEVYTLEFTHEDKTYVSMGSVNVSLSQDVFKAFQTYILLEESLQRFINLITEVLNDIDKEVVKYVASKTQFAADQDRIQRLSESSMNLRKERILLRTYNVAGTELVEFMKMAPLRGNNFSDEED